MNSNQLIPLSTKKSFQINGFDVISQDPDILSNDVRKTVVPKYLPVFLNIWKDIEAVTGYKWRCTSYLRDSFSHSKGHAIDLAPDISPSAKKEYAVYNNSDPILYKREPLIHALQSLKFKDYSADGSFSVGIFIEPDHLHIQVLQRTESPFTRVVKWQVPKPIYPDTYDRMKLPVLRENETYV